MLCAGRGDEGAGDGVGVLSFGYLNLRGRFKLSLVDLAPFWILVYGQSRIHHEGYP